MIEDLKKLKGMKFVGAGNDVKSMCLMFKGWDDEGGEVTVLVPWTDMEKFPVPDLQQAFDAWAKASNELVQDLMNLALRHQGDKHEQVEALAEGGCCGGSVGRVGGSSDAAGCSSDGGSCCGDGDCGRVDGCVPPASGDDRKPEGGG